MRVLHVINQFSDRAGAEISLREIVLGTAGELSHGIVVLTREHNRLDGLAEAGVSVFVPARRLGSTLARTWHVRRAIKAFRPDLVHTALFDANVAGRVAARLDRLPVLTSLVNTPYAPEALMDRSVRPSKIRAARAMDTVLSRHATTAFHAITHTVADWATECLGVERSRITVVPRGRSRASLGLPSARRRARARAALGVPDNAPLLLNVARQEAQKGQIYLVEAMAAVRQHHPLATLLLVGREGNRTPALNQRIDELGLRDAVRMLGVRHDVAELLCAADVFAFPSLYEGLGGAVLEAMALEVPIVASDAPALREVLDEGRCGRLMPIADPDALASAISAVLDDPRSMLSQVHAARARFDSTYELATCLEGMRALYAAFSKRTPRAAAARTKVGHRAGT